MLSLLFQFNSHKVTIATRSMEERNPERRLRVAVCAHRLDDRIAGLSDVSGPDRRNSKLDALWLFDPLPTKREDRTQTQERSFPVFLVGL
jgi:hypothetical protein